MWEYKVVGISHVDREFQLNEYGALGWELVAFDGGLAYFKRISEPARQIARKESQERLSVDMDTGTAASPDPERERIARGENRIARSKRGKQPSE